MWTHHGSGLYFNGAARVKVSAGCRPCTQVLFIRRADNPRDRWSGHIAFPGGRVDRASGEKAYDAAIREVSTLPMQTVCLHGGKQTSHPVSHAVLFAGLGSHQCLEEVGLDLSSPRYTLVGRLDDRAARGSSKSLVISPFVFMQLDTSTDAPMKVCVLDSWS